MFKRFLHLNLRVFNKKEVKVNQLRMPQGKSLEDVVKVLENFAPLDLAPSWDNVGLLLEPFNRRTIKRIILTNDLTEIVMKEVLSKKGDMIISYHPPIFTPLKRITLKSWKERIVSTCLSESVALYSPHTCWDSVVGGVNDWLAAALPSENIRPIEPFVAPCPNGTGAGRILNTDITLSNAIKNVQNHVGVDVHVALGVDHDLQTVIKTVAVCAGSGASLLKNASADLYITGEMSHHDVLEAQHKNTSVILCNHSNSERGYLKSFCSKLSKMLDGDCEIMLSEADEDPLRTHVKCG